MGRSGSHQLKNMSAEVQALANAGSREYEHEGSLEQTTRQGVHRHVAGASGAENASNSMAGMTVATESFTNKTSFK